MPCRLRKRSPRGPERFWPWGVTEPCGNITHLSYFARIWRTFWGHRFRPIRVEIEDELAFDGRGLVFVGVMHAVRVWRRIHVEHCSVIYKRCKRLRVSSAQRLAVEVDGDASGYLSVDISVKPAAGAMLMPWGY